MGKQFLKVGDSNELESLLNHSNERPVVVFKHSNSCPISAAAYREMQQLDSEVALVEVQSARDVSRELADITGVRHESPQVIVLRNGKAIWNASHYDVKAQEVAKVIQTNQ